MPGAIYTDMEEHHPTLQLLTVLSGGPVLELGVRAGDTTLPLLEVAHGIGTTVSGVDIERCPDAIERVMEADLEHIWSFEVSDSLTCKTPTSGWGLVFIDTSHTYEQTLAELRRFSGRFIALHDTEDPRVRRAIDEYVDETGMREFRWTNSHGLSVLMQDS